MFEFRIESDHAEVDARADRMRKLAYEQGLPVEIKAAFHHERGGTITVTPPADMLNTAEPLVRELFDASAARGEE